MTLALTFDHTTLPIRGPERVLAGLEAGRALAALGEAVQTFLAARRMDAAALAGVRISSHAPFATVVPYLSADLAAFDRWLVVPRGAMHGRRFSTPAPFHPSAVLRSVVIDPDQQSLLSYRYGLGVDNRRGKIKLELAGAARPHDFGEMAASWGKCRPIITREVRAAEEVFRRGRENKLYRMLSHLLSFDGAMPLVNLAAAFAPVTTGMEERVFYNWVSFLAALYPSDFGVFNLTVGFKRSTLEDMRDSSPYPWGQTSPDKVLMIRNPQNIADLYAAAARRTKKDGAIDLDWFMGKVRDLRVGRLWRWVVWAQALELRGTEIRVHTQRRVLREVRDTKHRIREIIKQKGPITIKVLAREYRKRFGRDEGLCATSYWLYISKDREIICVGRGLYDWVEKSEYARYRKVMARIPRVERDCQRRRALPAFNFIWVALHLHPEGLTFDALYREVQALGGRFKKCTIAKVLGNPDFRKYLNLPTRSYSLANRAA
jgi:hypothetical protein